MTHFTITLDASNNTSSNTLKKILSNIEGVMNVSVSKTGKSSSSKTGRKEMQEWIDDVKWLSDNFDSSSLDMSDERTRYLMSK